MGGTRPKTEDALVVVCKPLEIVSSSDRRFKKRFTRHIVLDFTMEKKKGIKIKIISWFS